MKTAITLASLTVAFLAFCLLQAWHWPIKAPPDWQPAWWQIQSLVGPGYYVAAPAFLAPVMLNKIGVESSTVQITVAAFITFIELTIVFYMMIGLTLHIQKRYCKENEPSSSSNPPPAPYGLQ
ncbi:hypothetical protein JIN85_18910 [Luteolibacter pohnpeiensis]|uniref:Uncharacterized protein n=1 Tax=Luteolibacter pohnpeiensis TaxID=454153 RepID=A0A934VYG5_9BACT|nr:hypothetical protein [Luteolibacter pohnpeiensis]MBK1884494.1 hypothetical protein [Luteolibacter pohnpeiensis]